MGKVKFLDSDVNAVDENGNTMLHGCTDRKTVETLLKNGANWRLANEDGDLPEDIIARKLEKYQAMLQERGGKDKALKDEVNNLKSIQKLFARQDTLQEKLWKKIERGDEIGDVLEKGANALVARTDDGLSPLEWAEKQLNLANSVDFASGDDDRYSAKDQNEAEFQIRASVDDLERIVEAMEHNAEDKADAHESWVEQQEPEMQKEVAMTDAALAYKQEYQKKQETRNVAPKGRQRQSSTYSQA